MRRASPAALLLPLLLALHARGENACEQIGVGARSLGMGGVDVAVAEDTSAMVTNPAGIAQIPGDRFDWGNGLYLPWTRFENPFNRSGRSAHRTPGDAFKLYFPQWGYVHRLEGTPWSVGVGLFTVGGGGSANHLCNEFYRRPKRTKSELAFVEFTPTIACRITPRLLVGASLNVYRCPLEVRILAGPLYLEVLDAEAWGWGYGLGVLWKPIDGLSLGLAYTSESHLQDFEGDRGYVEVAGVGRKRCRYSKVHDFQRPQKVAFGVAWRPNRRWLLAFDFEWQDYAQSFRYLIFSFRRPPGGLPSHWHPKLPLGWRDNYHLAFGVEYHATERLDLRMGYAYTPAHVTPDRGQYLYIPSTTADAHNVTAGFGYRLRRDLRMDLGWSHHLYTADAVRGSRLPDHQDSTVGFGDHFVILTLSWLRER